MKIINNSIKITLLVFGSLLFVQCTDVLDKTDLGNITDDLVWQDPALAILAVNELYDDSNSQWPIGASANSDNAVGRNNTMYGRLTDNSQGAYNSRYGFIRDANVILEGLDFATFDEVDKAPLRGQALFFRAVVYWNLVSTYGGVPIVTEVIALGGNLERPRNTTSECMVQIISDLDAAIGALPDAYDGNNYGRITKGAAMALKGRILMHYASEQFDPNQSNGGRWQAAYTALTEAKTNLDANGKGLHSNYADLWFDDNSSNPEAIWVKLYNSDSEHNRDRTVRPFQPGIGGGRTDNATVSLLDAYPMKDGKMITDNTSAYTYDPVVIWKDRDPRLTATNAYNGAVWPLNVEVPYQTSDLIWSFQNYTTVTESDNQVTYTSFYNRKAVDPSIGFNENSTTQWIEMRYAEVLLNLAEAANEIGNGAEALTHIMAIRERAGIENGDSRYGLMAGLEGNIDAMRDAVLLEKRIEFAFEGKRAVDLRRRRLYSTLNGTERMGYYIVKTSDF